MSLQFGPAKIGAMQYNGVTIGEAMYNGQVVFRSDSRPVVAITGTSGFQSRDQFRQACIDYGTTYQTVQVLPFRLDLTNATNTNSMFRDCTALTSVPTLDTSNVTTMNRMFYNCSSLTSVTNLDTSQATNISYMFYGCSSLAYVSDMNTSNVTNTNYMFYDCSALTDGNVRLIGKHPSVNTNGMINSSGLTREPFYNAAGDPI